MKNFWLERKQTQSKFIQLKSSYGITIRMVDQNEFIDLSQIKGSNSSYKEYEKIKETWESALELFAFESKGEPLPPWNIDNYQGFDPDEEQPVPEKTTYPEIYGFKTPEKHTIGYINEDEPPVYTKCWKRTEIHSGSGFLIMKDEINNQRRNNG